MQLLCSLLTGLFLWLFVYQWLRKSIARWRQVAGEELYTAVSRRPRWLRWLFFVYLSAILLGQIYHALSFPDFTLESQFSLASLLTVVLLLGIPVTANIAIEVRRRGVFCSRVGDRVSTRRLHFVPWNQIATCQWVPKRFGVISRFDDARCCLTVAHEAVRPEQKAAVTAAVGQFVPVYDCDGAVLARPDEAHRKAKSVPWRSLDRPPFQFDLQTMLLLVVVVACAASLAGIRYRSPEFQAEMKLAAFSPKIDYWGTGDVYELDFSGCANKPTDDDLTYIEPLAELRKLDLAGAPITDAGLAHLKGLKKLDYVNLANTAATAQGMEDLRRALPKTKVEKRVLWSPPGVVPLAPSPPKGKRRR